ncbi:hypothetical protein GCM10007391_26020 [Alteromonas halophila]|uniref:Uncharacterized protein n=1 Tax=Alteromonas halophila TaxID=516698 RepID=A0A918JMZ6_9ALTE|nr:hypothetical protein GCM10007391_26020 [Alteromonas halophila]
MGQYSQVKPFFAMRLAIHRLTCCVKASSKGADKFIAAQAHSQVPGQGNLIDANKETP